MKRYEFKFNGFDEMLDGANEKDKEYIKDVIENYRTNANDKFNAYKKIESFINGQNLNIHDDDVAYLELFDYSCGVYIECSEY